jgi:hypothetical protein
MTEIANVPAHDKFQIFTLFEPDELAFPSQGHLDIDYTQDIIFIQVYWASSSTTDTKTAFFRGICDDLHARWAPDGLFLPMPIAQTGHLEQEKCKTNLDCRLYSVIRLQPFPLRDIGPFVGWSKSRTVLPSR